jgi:hypothetical protein
MAVLTQEKIWNDEVITFVSQRLTINSSLRDFVVF